MKIVPALLMTSLCLASIGANAAESGDIKTAKDCLAYGKRVMKNNPDMMVALNQAKIKNEGIQINRYEEKVGKQPVSSEVVATISSSQEIRGSILCLYESDKKPLYFHYTPFE